MGSMMFALPRYRFERTWLGLGDLCRCQREDEEDEKDGFNLLFAVYC